MNSIHRSQLRAKTAIHPQNYRNPFIMNPQRILVLLSALLLSTSAWAQTDRERCATPARSLIPPNTLAPSDCGYSTNTPDPQYDPTFIYDIPVVVHLIQNTAGDGFLSASTIQDQIDILNEDFQAIAGSPGGPGTNGQISFHLATSDPQGNPTSGITYTTNDNWFLDQGNYWDPLSWDTNLYLNIYINANPGYYGYAYVPQQGGVVGWTGDRIVLWYEAVGRNGTSGWPGNMGRTGTHEVGHYLGLFHTFDGGCGSSSNCYGTGDLICDTNPQANYTDWCTSPSSSCGSVDQTQNYMDYTDDQCLWEFTPEQINRMRCTLENWRPDLWDTPQGQEVVRLGSPANPDAFRPGQTRPPTAGLVWDPMVDHTTFMPSAVTDMICISLNSANVYIAPYGTLLCQRPFLRTFTNSSAGTPFNLSIPANTEGLTFSAQAASVDASGQLLVTNALDCVISN
jgi:hypothetical protein